MVPGFNRRRLLFSLGVSLPPIIKGAAQQKLPPAPGEFQRVLDGVTENVLVRLTSPAYTNILPAAPHRFYASKQRWLLCASDRFGSFSPHAIDLRAGSVRQLTQTTKMQPEALAVDAAGRFIYYLDDHKLCELALTARREPKRPEVLSNEVSSFALGASRGELFAVCKGHLQQVGAVSPTVLSEDAGRLVSVRPSGRGCLFERPSTRENEIQWWYASPNRKATLLLEGRIANPWWSDDGATLYFLRYVPRGQALLSELHAVLPDSGVERTVSVTSQFAAFAMNADSSVVAGISGSRAQPNVVLMLPELRRELTLCGHNARAAGLLSIGFSPDSRRLYFENDREGKSAIYSANVELLVEPTRTES